MQRRCAPGETLAYLVTANDPMVPRRLFDAYIDDPVDIFLLWCEIVPDFTSRTVRFGDWASKSNR